MHYVNLTVQPKDTGAVIFADVNYDRGQFECHCNQDVCRTALRGGAGMFFKDADEAAQTLRQYRLERDA